MERKKEKSRLNSKYQSYVGLEKVKINKNYLPLFGPVGPSAA